MWRCYESFEKEGDSKDLWVKREFVEQPRLYWICKEIYIYFFKCKIAKCCPEYISLVVEVSSCSDQKTVWSEVEFLVLSQLEFLSFVAIWVLKFCHNSSFWALSQFEFCNNLSFWVLALLDFFLIYEQFGFCYNFMFEFSHFQVLSFVIIWDFELPQFQLLSYHNLSFLVVTFRFMEFCLCFEFCQNLSCCVLSQWVFCFQKVF